MMELPIESSAELTCHHSSVAKVFRISKLEIQTANRCASAFINGNNAFRVNLHGKQTRMESKLCVVYDFHTSSFQ